LWDFEVLNSFVNLLILQIAFFLLTSGNWIHLESEHFTLFYHEEDERSAKEILKFGEEVYLPIAIHLGIDPSKMAKTRIYLTSTQEDFDRLTRAGVPDWGIGCALPHENTIVLKAPRIIGKNPNLRSLIAHEFSHILLHRLSLNEGRRVIPRWFDEGLAMFESKEWKVAESMTLAWAVISNSLLPLSAMERGFPVNEKKARLAYTQSFSTIAYIIQEYGEEGLQILLKNLSTARDFEEALVKSFGSTLTEFEKEWMTHLKNNYNFLYILSDSGILWGVITLLFLFTLIIKMSKIRKKKQELKESEELPGIGG
jgi:hypothetical protein